MAERAIDYKFLFRTCISQAKKHFEAAQQRSGDLVHLTDSMLYECAKARRLVRDAPDELIESFGVNRDEFLGIMDDVAAHRNVTEHWGDIINPRKATQHVHHTALGLISVDETSVISLGPDQIYRGKLNLHDVYVYLGKVAENIPK